jgi:hypothetical protein
MRSRSGVDGSNGPCVGRVVDREYELPLIERAPEIADAVLRLFLGCWGVVALVAPEEILFGDSVDGEQVVLVLQQTLAVLRDDQKVAARPTLRVLRDAANEFDHLSLRLGARILVVLERVDDVEINALEARFENEIEIRSGVAEYLILPRRLPEADFVVPRPIGVFVVEPRRRSGAPRFLPIEAILFCLTDAHVRDDATSTSVGHRLHRLDLARGERLFRGAVCRVVDYDQFEPRSCDAVRLDAVELVRPAPYLGALLSGSGIDHERERHEDERDTIGARRPHEPFTEMRSNTSSGNVTPFTETGSSALVSTFCLTRTYVAWLMMI